MASLSFEDDGVVHRLEGSSDSEQGGLVIMKKPSGEAHTFKKPDMPKVSLFGLDKLAALKRETENLEGGTTPKRSKVSSYRDEDDDDDDDDDNASCSGGVSGSLLADRGHSAGQVDLRNVVLLHGDCGHQ